jgi:hypothetical protein
VSQPRSALRVNVLAPRFSHVLHLIVHLIGSFVLRWALGHVSNQALMPSNSPVSYQQILARAIFRNTQVTSDWSEVHLSKNSDTSARWWHFREGTLNDLCACTS